LERGHAVVELGSDRNELGIEAAALVTAGEAEISHEIRRPLIIDLESRIKIVVVACAVLASIRTWPRKIVSALAVEIAVARINIRNRGDIAAARQIGRVAERVP